MEKHCGWLSRFGVLSRDRQQLRESVSGLHNAVFVTDSLKNVVKIVM